MRRFTLMFAIAAAVSSAAIRGDGKAVPDVLGGVRQALGCDAALTAVTSFTINGSHVRQLGAISLTSQLEITCVLPDKFVSCRR